LTKTLHLQSFQRHAITLVAALLLSMWAPRIYAQVHIAVVDLQRALNETEDGRRAKARLKRLFKQRQQELDKAQGELKSLKEEFDSQSDTLSDSARQERLDAIQKQFVELQSTYVEYQRELAEKEAEMTQEIIARMETILRRIGQEEGYTLIVERNEGGVIFVPGNLDLTDVVIQRYNAGEGREADSEGSSSSSTGSGSGSGTGSGTGGSRSTKRSSGATGGGAH
jgi:outer membrane protein